MGLGIGDNFTKNGIFDDVWGSKGLPQNNLNDYTQASAQTSQQSLYAAIVNAMLSRPDQSTPYGSRAFTQTGTTRVGNFDVPTYASNTTLSPTEQGVFDRTQVARTGAADKLATNNFTPVLGAGDLTGARDQVQKALFDRSMSQLQPGFDINRDRVRTDLANRGFSVQDKGYDNAWSTMVENPEALAKSQASNSSIAGGDASLGMLSNLSMQQNQQEYGQAMGTLTGAQPVMPAFDNFAAGGVTGADPFAAMTASDREALQAYGLETQRAWAEHQGGMDVWKQSTGAGGPMGAMGGAK